MLELLKKRKKKFILYLIASTFPVIRELLRTGLFAFIFYAIQKKDIETLKLSVLLGAIFIVLSFILYITSRLMRISFMRDTLLDVRINAFEKIIKLDYTNFSKKSKDVYISNLVNDINNFENNFFINFLNFIFRVIQYIVAIILLLIIDPIIAIIIVLCSLIVYAVIKLFEKKTKEAQKDVSESSEDLTINLSNTFNGLEILKQNNIEDKFTSKSFDKIDKVENYKFRFRYLSEAQRYITNTIGFLIFIGLLLYLISQESFDYAKTMLIIQFSMMIIYGLSDIFPRLNVIKSSAEIYTKITKPEFQSKEENKHNAFKFDNLIEVNNLSFSYDNKQIFNNTSFTIEKGKKYLIKGPSGIGKSTLIKLLSQTYEDYEGAITIDGVNLKTINNKSLSEKIAFVYQDVFLFEDTIRNNITLYKELSDEKVKEAITLSGLSSFMENKTLNDVIEENGKNLSGGERQRISIARAIAKDAEILFIDEGTSSLNQELGSMIEEKITNLNTTVIAISHRYYPNISEKYDYVLEIKEGKVTKYPSRDYFASEAKYV